MKAALEGSERLERMRSNMMRYDVPRLRAASVAICGFGPSLIDTYQHVQACSAVMTTSGAHDLLIDNGIIPNYHVECDPREHKVEFLRHPRKETVYLVNSICHPSMFDALKGYNVVMWHGATDDDSENQQKLVGELDPGGRLLNGGTNVGMRALMVARELGFSHFECHGMDCSIKDGLLWAGLHFGKLQGIVTVEVEGRKFQTTAQMMQSTDDFFNSMSMLPGCKFIVHGGGLLEERVNLYKRNPEKALSDKWFSPVDFIIREAA